MSYELISTILFVIFAIVGWIFAYIQMIRADTFEKLKLAPHPSIGATMRQPKKGLHEIRIFVDNGGETPIIDPIWSWRLKLKNGKYYWGKWKPFFDSTTVSKMRSFIRPLDPLSQTGRIINFQNPEIELKIMDVVDIWMKYGDIINRRWLVYTQYKWMGDWWKPIRKTKKILAPKPSFNRCKIWRM